MVSEECVLCKSSADDVLKFGTKYKTRHCTAHLFCLLLNPNLKQKDEENNGLHGYLPDEVRNEGRRARRQECYICEQSHASITCCDNSCYKAFHLSCGLKRGCRFEFTGRFKSYCKQHIDIEKAPDAHKETDACAICYDDLGKYHRTKSIRSPCCDRNSWYHKKCLQKYAQLAGAHFKCPLCNNKELFRKKVTRQGIYIPMREAEWMHSDFDMPQMSPSPPPRVNRRPRIGFSCSAEPCLCPFGPSYTRRGHRHHYSIIRCFYCGTRGAHQMCTGPEFLCQQCIESHFFG